MSVYNGARYLREAIDSILNQTFTDFEFIIVNDGSTDATATILNSYTDPHLKIISNPQNLGLTKSLNVGLKHCRGEYIARLDTDDISLSNRLKEQINFMTKNSNISISGSFMNIIDEYNNIISINKIYPHPKVIKFLLLFKNPILHSSIMIKFNDLKSLNFYNESYEYSQDLELYSRALDKNFIITIIPKILVSSRIHKETISKNPASNKIQRHNRQKICLKNISRYLELSVPEKKYISSFLWDQKIDSLKNLIKIRSILKKIKKTFLLKEKVSIEEEKIINIEYKKRTKPLLKIYLKNNFPKIHTLMRKILNQFLIKENRSPS